MIIVYGPYLRKDGRKHVVHYDTVAKTRRTESYPRYLMEQSLGRPLLDDETVDHINEDFTDDRLENLQILTRIDNIKKSAPGVEMMIFCCPTCSEIFEMPARTYRANQLTKIKRGPYCSRRCAGIANH